MYVTVTIPAVPAGVSVRACWRRTVASLDRSQHGGYAVRGEQLTAGERARLPVGTLVFGVDRRDVGLGSVSRTRQHRPAEDATVTVLLVREEGLAQVWQRHFATARSAVGPTTLKRLEALLAEHPPPGGTVQIRQPNERSGRCCWCGEHVPVRAGHQNGRGQVEHWESCPYLPAENGAVCAVCGRTVVASDARRELREPRAQGVWETRHPPYLDCATHPQRTWQDHLDHLASTAADSARAREEGQRRAAEAAREDAAEQQAVRTEDEQVTAFLAGTSSGDSAAPADGEQPGPVRVLGKPLRDGRRFALYLVPHADRAHAWQMIALIAGQITAGRFAERPHRNPASSPGLTHVLALPAPTGHRQAVGLTEQEARAVTTALREWEQRPARALRAAAPGAPTWPVELLTERPRVGDILHDPRTGRDGIVLGTRAVRVEEDGRSFGLMAEDGWLYTATVREPTPTERTHATGTGDESPDR
ncbi:hypothetical protein ACFWGI_36725 [Streptomyces niveus]|uniref:hypothetical protein n=1 Tax=Streptomyces niveus TaxID=193462 RepID=UPI0036631D51